PRILTERRRVDDVERVCADFVRLPGAAALRPRMSKTRAFLRNRKRARNKWTSPLLLVSIEWHACCTDWLTGWRRFPRCPLVNAPGGFMRLAGALRFGIALALGSAS